MSGIPMRKRKLSSQQFFTTAQKIVADVRSVAFQDNVIPKKYRFAESLPMLETAKRIVFFINLADAFYPSNSSNVIERKKNYNKAIGCCDDLSCQMQSLIDDPKMAAAASKFEGIAATLIEEVKMLKTVRDNTKPLRIGGKDYEEWVSDAEEELERRIALRDEAAAIAAAKEAEAKAEAEQEGEAKAAADKEADASEKEGDA